MIRKCNYCHGTGFIRLPTGLLSVRKECPICHGAGEFKLIGNPDNYLTCKLCGGSGARRSNNILISEKIVCSTCNGIGLITRPQIGKKNTNSINKKVDRTESVPLYEFDIAISFAGEDRQIAYDYKKILEKSELKIFYDKDHIVDLWGVDLIEKLHEIYSKKAFLCIIFVSEHYLRKYWTKHEKRSALERALKENREYILPVKLDNSSLPGLPSTVGYVDLRQISIEKLAELTIEKYNRIQTRT